MKNEKGKIMKKATKVKMNEKHIIKFLNNKHECFVVKIKYLKIKFENMKNKLNE